MSVYGVGDGVGGSDRALFSGPVWQLACFSDQRELSSARHGSGVMIVNSSVNQVEGFMFLILATTHWHQVMGPWADRYIT